MTWTVDWPPSPAAIVHLCIAEQIIFAISSQSSGLVLRVGRNLHVITLTDLEMYTIPLPTGARISSNMPLRRCCVSVHASAAVANQQPAVAKQSPIIMNSQILHSILPARLEIVRGMDQHIRDHVSALCCMQGAVSTED